MRQRSAIIALSLCVLAGSLAWAHSIALAHPAGKAVQAMDGAWALSIASPHGPITARLALAIDAGTVSGTCTNPHGGHDLSVEGTALEGRLRLVVVLPMGDQDATLTLTGALQADGTLAGTLSSPMGDLTWTAARDLAKVDHTDWGRRLHAELFASLPDSAKQWLLTMHHAHEIRAQ